jgi:hypothetical protein
MPTTEQQEHRRDKNDLQRALQARDDAKTETHRHTAETKVAAVILRPLWQSLYKDVPDAALADLAKGLKAAANAGTYDGGFYGDDYTTAAAKVAKPLGIDLAKIPSAVHDRIRRLT